MSPGDTRPTSLEIVRAAATALNARREEVDRLNVFPVPDGDTGTNMSLTMDAVLGELEKLPGSPAAAAVCHAVAHGSLMGARGNSGVILSQILRGACETVDGAGSIDGRLAADALARAVKVAYQAVRKPVEGTMLTVVKDAAAGAKAAADKGEDLLGVLEAAVKTANASVRRTPELLSVLKEAGVVDAGGFGVAILLEGLTAALAGHEVRAVEVAVPSSPLAVAPEQDWDDQEYLYCTEFLLHGEGLQRDRAEKWTSRVGGSELVVGDDRTLKVHVHTDDPGKVLAHFTALGEVSEVHVNNMRRQTQARAEALSARPAKPVGFVAVAAGEGLKAILESLGVDSVVSGGQTMNPSTAEILEAVEQVQACAVVVLPGNKNIVMAARQVPALSTRLVAVVPTTSVPASFAAMLAYDPDVPLEANVDEMTGAASRVRTGEVTHAIKDSTSAAGSIRAGQVIGIADHEVRIVGDDVVEVTLRLANSMAPDAETLTLLAGEQLSDEDMDDLAARLGQALPGLEVEAHRGGQPLYPVILSVE